MTLGGGCNLIRARVSILIALGMTSFVSYPKKKTNKIGNNGRNLQVFSGLHKKLDYLTHQWKKQANK